MAHRVVAGAVTVAFLASLWRQGLAATCGAPDKISGTRHNGTSPVYNPGDVLFYACDTGYNLNYNNPTAVCRTGNDGTADWDPANVACEIDYVSLVIAVVVALVGLVVFALSVCWLCKRRRERDSRRIKRKARQNTYANYEPRGSGKQNGHVNAGMTDIEMTGIPIRTNGSVHGNNNEYPNGNGLLWNPPSSRGTVKHDEEVAVLQRSRKSSASSRASTTDNTPKTAVKSGVQLKPDYGDVEFGAGDAHLHNFRDIGSSITAMANPIMGVNMLEKSLPMPDAHSPTMTSDENLSPPPSARDYGDMYASVDISRKSTNRRKLEDKIENSDDGSNNVVTVATIERDGGYSSVGAHSGSFTAHAEAIGEDGGYSSIKLHGVDDADGDYAEVRRLDDAIDAGENDFDGLYAKVKK